MDLIFQSLSLLGAGLYLGAWVKKYLTPQHRQLIYLALILFFSVLLLSGISKNAGLKFCYGPIFLMSAFLFYFSNLAAWVFSKKNLPSPGSKIALVILILILIFNSILFLQLSASKISFKNSLTPTLQAILTPSLQASSKATSLILVQNLESWRANVNRMVFDFPYAHATGIPASIGTGNAAWPISALYVLFSLNLWPLLTYNFYSHPWMRWLMIWTLFGIFLRSLFLTGMEGSYVFIPQMILLSA